MNRASQHAWVTDEATVALVRRLAEYYDDTHIALILSRLAAAPGCASTKIRIKSLARCLGIPRLPTTSAGLSEKRCKWLDTPAGWLAGKGH